MLVIGCKVEIVRKMVVTNIFSRLLVIILGTLYPAYRSYKAVKYKDGREYAKWMMYWIVFAIFQSCEAILDMFLFWLPFYYELKLLFIVYLVFPFTQGASILYRKVVHPYMLRHENDIDLMMDNAKQKGFALVTDVGVEGIRIANRVVRHAVNEGLKRSLSINDLPGTSPTMRVEQVHVVRRLRDNDGRIEEVTEDDSIVVLDQRCAEPHETKARRRRKEAQPNIEALNNDLLYVPVSQLDLSSSENELPDSQIEDNLDTAYHPSPGKNKKSSVSVGLSVQTRSAKRKALLRASKAQKLPQLSSKSSLLNRVEKV